MSSRAAVIGLLSLVGCAAHHPVGDAFPVTDAPPETTYAQPSGPSLITPDPQTSELAVGADAAEPDASCAAIAMADGAADTTCAATSFAFAGGTIAPGTYTLSQWADDASSCIDPSSPSTRRATMIIEQRGDAAVVMRWLRVVDGVTTSGSYRLDANGDAMLRRADLCANADPLLLSYTATPEEIDLAWSGGQETWTLVP